MSEVGEGASVPPLLPRLQFRYCPMCRSDLVSRLDAERIARSCCPNCNWVHYPGSATGVNVVITRGDDEVVILLPPGEPVETPGALPGGHLEYGESPEQGAVREAFEETGLETEVVACLGWYFWAGPGYPGPMIAFSFEVRAIGGELKGSSEGGVTVVRIESLASVISPNRGGSVRAMRAFLAFRGLRFDRGG